MWQPKSCAHHGCARTPNDTADSALPGLAGADCWGHFVMSEAFANVHGGGITYPDNCTEKKHIPWPCWEEAQQDKMAQGPTNKEHTKNTIHQHRKEVCCMGGADHHADSQRHHAEK